MVDTEAELLPDVLRNEKLVIGRAREAPPFRYRGALVCSPKTGPGGMRVSGGP